MERKWIVVAFGDISGFSAWRRRASTQPEIAQPFLKKFYNEIDSFAVKNQNIYLKYLGDGLMILKELDEDLSKHKCAINFIQQAGLLNARLLRVVRGCEWPPPDGFRMRAVCGHVDKILVTDPNSRKQKIPEYIGYAINLAQKLLNISPDTPFICHESLTKIFGKFPRRFSLSHFNVIEEKRKGIDPEDIAGLWEIKFR